MAHYPLWLLNAKAIFVEEQKSNYLTYSWSGFVSLIHGTSTFMGYLMPKPSL